MHVVVNKKLVLFFHTMQCSFSLFPHSFACFVSLLSSIYLRLLLFIFTFLPFFLFILSVPLEFPSPIPSDIHDACAQTDYLPQTRGEWIYVQLM